MTLGRRFSRFHTWFIGSGSELNTLDHPDPATFRESDFSGALSTQNATEDSNGPFRPKKVPFSDEVFADDCPVWFDPTDYQCYTGQPDYVFQDGEHIDLGDRKLKLLHTPGHAPGHCCFHESDRGYLFTGDLAYPATIYLQADLPGTSPTDYRKSIERVDDLEDVDWLFPAHEQYCVSPDLVTAIRRHLEGTSLTPPFPDGELPDPWSDVQLDFE